MGLIWCSCAFGFSWGVSAALWVIRKIWWIFWFGPSLELREDFVREMTEENDTTDRAAMNFTVGGDSPSYAFLGGRPGSPLALMRGSAPAC